MSSPLDGNGVAAWPPGLMVFLDGRNEHGTHVLPSLPVNLPLDAIATLIDSDTAETIFTAAEALGLKAGDHAWTEWAWNAPEYGEYGQIASAGWWEFKIVRRAPAPSQTAVDPDDAQLAEYAAAANCERCGGSGYTGSGDRTKECPACGGFGIVKAGERDGAKMRQGAPVGPATPAAFCPQTAVEPAAWRCFHCGDVFTDEHAARLHFGSDETQAPACQIKGAEGGLVEALRRAEKDCADAWHAIHSEATDSAKAYFGQAARHQEQLRVIEQVGYDRGITDAKAHPETLGLVPLSTLTAQAAALVAANASEQSLWDRPDMRDPASDEDIDAWISNIPYRGEWVVPGVLFRLVERVRAEAAESEVATLKARIAELEAGLEAILRHGELANVPTGSPFASYGGKKPPSKDVFAFPRHMLTGIEEVLARRLTHQEKNNG